MERDGKCFFCNIIDGGLDFRGIRPEILLETRNHIVIPEAHNMLDETVYTLTIAKDHVKCMRDLPPEQIDEKKRIESLLRGKIFTLTGREVISFEHGADSAKSVDHAHTHYVGNDGFEREIEQKIFQEIFKKTFGATKPEGWSICLRSVRSEAYLYYRDTDGKEYTLLVPNDVQSQFIRNLLWKSSGEVGDFYQQCNWKNPTPEIVKKFFKNEQFTIDVLKGAITDKDKALFGL